MVIGIDGAGKSTIINHIKPASTKCPGEAAPTVGCAVEELKYGGCNIKCFDMAGGSKYRNMWASYYGEADGLVYVVDSADAMRMCAIQCSASPM